MSISEDPKLGTAPTAAPGSIQTAASVGPDVASAQTVASVEPTGPVLTPADLMPVHEAMYLRLDELARGGLGKISRARDVRTGRIVAIKEVIASSEDATVRFAREAMITATLQHPSIVPVYEVGRWPSGEPFYAMKLVRGQSFDKVIAAAHDLDARIALVSHVLAVADALAYAHGERVIHRDLKPHNVLCGAYGETVVIDWGLARQLDEQDATTSLHRRISAAPGETYVGAVMGTPAYMPPEQASGKRVDERADVYAIGAMLYHLLAGAPAYTGKTLDELLLKVKAGPPRRLAELVPEVPADLAAIVERAMSPDPEARYRTAAELATDLRRFTTGQLVLAHRYTPGQRMRRFIARHRGAFIVATVALVALILVVSVAFAGVLSARDDAEREQGRAEGERARADRERDEAQRQLVAAHIDRARIELAARPRTALAFVTAAAEVGGLDPTLSYLAALVLDVIPDTRVLPSEQVTLIAAVPGSHDVIVGSEHGTTRWNPDTNRPVWNLPQQNTDVFAIDANRLLTIRPTGFYVLDAATGKDRHAMLVPAGKSLIGLAALDSTGRWASAVTANSVELVDVAAGRLVASVPITDPARSPYVSPDGDRLAVMLNATNKQLGFPIGRLIDRSGRVLRELCNECDTLRPLGSKLAVIERPVGRPHQVLLVDWSGATVGTVVLGSSAEASDLAISPDGNQLAVVHIDGLVEVHDLTKGLQWRTTIPNRASELRFDPRGRLWVLGMYDQTYMFDLASGIELGRWAVGGLAMAIADDGERISVASTRTGITSWRVRGKGVTAIAPSAARVRRFVFLDGGNAAVSSDDGAITIVEPGGAQRTFATHEKRIVSMQRTADGALMSSARDGTTVVRDLATGRELERYALGPHAAVSPDGKQLAIDGPGNTVQLIDRATKVARTLATFPDEVANIRWSADGSRLAAIDNLSQIIVWAADGTKIKEVPPFEMGVDIVFSTDGRWLGRVANTKQNILYSLVPGGKDLELESSAERTHSLSAAIAFSPDDQRVAIADQGRIRIWSLPTATLERTIATGSDTYALAFSADGRLLYAGGVARTIVAWDVARGISYGELPTTSDVYGLVFDQDRRRLAIQTLGPALVWNVPQLAVDLPKIRQIASCANELNPVTGIATPIDVVVCNRLSRP